MLPEVEQAAATLAAAGVASPRHDAEELAAHVLGVSRSRLVLLDRLPAETAGRYAELVEQRAARVPLQHLTGVAGFRRLDLAVGPGVFVPRPETEVLVDWVLARLRRAWPPPRQSPPAPASNASVSAFSSAAMTSSRLPSRTWSRL